MNESQRDELLVRLDERVDNIRSDQKKFHTAAVGLGWGRCQVHTNDIKDIKSTMKWANRGIGGLSLAMIGKFIYSFFVPNA